MILRLPSIDRKMLSGYLGGIFNKIGSAEHFLLGRKSEKNGQKRTLGTNGLRLVLVEIFLGVMAHTLKAIFKDWVIFQI